MEIPNAAEINQLPPYGSDESYERSEGFDLHGAVHQWKNMMLVVHRARKKKYLFRFATEMKQAGKFDDAVLEYEDLERGKVHLFLQFKHEKACGMVNYQHLLSTAKNPPFGMVKYFNSWREIRNNTIFDTSKSKEFILCTNMGLDKDKLKDIKVTDMEVYDLLKVPEMKGDEEPRPTPCFHKFVDETSILRDKLKSEASASNDEISDFFKEFILAVNQPNEKELGPIIANELGASHQFNLRNVNFIGDGFQDMMVNLLKNTGKHRKFLSSEQVDAFFQKLYCEMCSHITIGLKLSYTAELKEYDIKFQDKNCDLRKFLDGTDLSRTSPLILTSLNPTLLIALRVYQAVEESERYTEIDNSIFIRLEELSRPNITDKVLCAFGSSISHDLLVIDCGLVGDNENTHSLLSRLRDILENIPGKKLILIIHENDSPAVREIFSDRDDIKIDDSIIALAERSRQKLLEKRVIKFQGDDKKKISFKEIFGSNESDDIGSKELSALNKLIDKKTLIQLIRGEEIVIGSEIQGLDDVEKYYIPRTIVERVVIKAEILKDSNISDLFAISGIDQEALEKIVATENRNQLIDECSLRKLDSDKFYILESGREADHFRNICEQNPERNIHWLQGETGALVWQQSFGSITNLRAFRYTSMDYYNHKRPGANGLTEDELAKHDKRRQIVIISDTAGMGKSTLLTYLAGKIKHDQSSLLVIRVDLTQHTGVLNKEKEKRTFEKDDTNGAVNFLVDKLSNLSTDFERNVFKEIVKVTGETAVLIDGYDEICPHFGKIVIDLLRSLANIPIKRLFVTTRPHTSKVLEREFGTFSHVLQPFDRENQMKFLTKFWGRELNSNDSDGTIEENLEQHASAVLGILSKLINSQMQEFTGIPLQLRLVAEAFPVGNEEKLKRFESSEKPLYITDLYGCFVDEKFYICLKKKLSSDHTNLVRLKKYRKAIRRIFLMTHQELALKALFDENTVTALMNCKHKTDETSSSSEDEEDEDEGEERSGIVTQVINGKPHFVHRTFAEYFTAKFLSKKLKDNGCDLQVQKFFVEEFLIEEEYQTIRKFLNCLLCRRDHAPEKYSWEFDLTENCRTRGRTLYHVAAKEYNIGIVRFFSIRLGQSLVAELPRQDPNINLEDKHHKTPLMNAVSRHRHVIPLVQCLVDGGADVNHRSSVQYFVENGADINGRIPCSIFSGYTPLHTALRKKPELDLIRYLVEILGANVNIKATNGYTPFYLSRKHKAGPHIGSYLKHWSRQNEAVMPAPPYDYSIKYFSLRYPELKF